MALAVQTQRDFSGGSYLNPARELIPDNGFAYAINGLLEEDGTIFRRGGSTYKSTSDFAANYTFLWDGYLSAGQRTVMASAAAFGVLDVDDATPLSLGNSGTDGQRPASGNYLLFTPLGASGSAGQVAVYGGSRKTVDYSTGTITATVGSKTVTGAGTAFSANVDAGMILISGSTVIGTVFSVDSNTQITLRDSAYAAFAGAAFSAKRVHIYTPIGALPISAVATVSNPARLIVASGSDIYSSANGNPFLFSATDYHRLPQGTVVVGMEALRNILFAFSTAGVFTITGMDYQLTDAYGNIQQRLEQINRDLVLWDARGIAGWHGALVVPAIDEVFLVTDTAAPQPLADPIIEKYRAYVRAGYQCGFATVYRNHYFLPILNGNTWIDTLVCRLDQGGWTFWDGNGGTSVGFVSRSGATTRNPFLFSANTKRILNLTGTFTPDTTNPSDADATTHLFSLVTRDYTTDGLRKALVKKLRVRYELNTTGAGVLRLGYSTGQVVTSNPLWDAITWDAFTWDVSSTEQFSAVPGNAPADNGTNPYVWPVIPTETGVRPRFARFRLQQSGSVYNLKIRSLEAFIRPGGRQ